MKCSHVWCYSDGNRGSAPHSDDNDRHVVDVHCVSCKKTGVEVYTFEGFEESK